MVCWISLPQMGHVYPQVDALKVGQKYLQRKEVYRNLGNGKFEEVAHTPPGFTDGQVRPWIRRRRL